MEPRHFERRVGSAPTLTFVVSSNPMPGYSVASLSERIFGDGLIHVCPVSSNHIDRDQFSILMTRRSAPIFRSAFIICPSSPIV
jgi:hypothetical protein